MYIANDHIELKISDQFCTSVLLEKAKIIVGIPVSILITIFEARFDRITPNTIPPTLPFIIE